MQIAPLGDADVAPVAAAIARWQALPVSHVCYLDVEPAAIAEELADEPAWRERTVVAREDGEVRGVVLASVDEERGRVWWFGPWGSTHEVRTAVIEAAVALLPPGVDEEEFGPDERNHAVAAIAEERGCVRNTGSFVLTLDPLVVPTAPATADVEIMADPATHETALAALHDVCFPGTHTTGASLVAAEDTDLLAATDRHGAFLGYLAGEVQPDGGGYVDYLGTEPAARRRGVASALLVEQLRRWEAAGVERCHLTVREDRPGARALYEGLGFVHERTIAPWRRGFDLG